MACKVRLKNIHKLKQFLFTGCIKHYITILRFVRSFSVHVRKTICIIFFTSKSHILQVVAHNSYTINMSSL